MNAQYIKSPQNTKLEISVYQGHFATRNSHNSHYIDITRMKHEHTMAREAAITLAQRYAYVNPIDTIVCMDGSEVIGAFLARHLAQKDRFNINVDKNINVVTPEFDHTGQLIFRDNLVPMVSGKNVLLREYENITKQPVSEKLGDDFFRTLGQRLAAGAWWKDP